MREKYHTEALILKVSEFKESNLLYHVLSKEFGFIIATAQSTRLLRSKLRYGLQEFSVADISIVRTGDVWKITNSTPKQNLFFSIDDKKNKEALARIFQFLRRFLGGEQAEKEIYDDVLTIAEILQKGGQNGAEEVFILRSLYHLGLLKESARLGEALAGKSFEETSDLLRENLDEVIKAVNSSLKESQV